MIRIPVVPITFNEAYGVGQYTAKFIRTDGTVVDLGQGYGMAEHFIGLFPDMFWLCPILLILLVLSWGFTSVLKRRNNGDTTGKAWVVIGLLILAVFYLWWLWS
jgi:hypothetical protein